MNIFRKVLAAIDVGEPESAKFVTRAALEAIEEKDTLFVLSVVPDYGAGVVGTYFPADFQQNAIERATEALHAFTKENVPSDVSLQHIVSHGSIYEEIIAAADKLEADLIVVGSHRPRLQDYLVGPNAERVVRHAVQSVLVARLQK